MLPAWRLAIRNVSARRRRMTLLGAAVALSAALISAIACAMGAINASIGMQLESVVGRADARIAAPGRSAQVPLDLLETVRAWPGVALATGHLEAEFPLAVTVPALERNPAQGETAPAYTRRSRTLRVSPLVRAVVDDAGWKLRPVQVIAGRLPAAQGEIAIDAFTASRLSVMADEDLALNGIGVVVGDPARFALPPVPVPETAVTEAEARRINDRQGARLGSTVEVRRLLGQPARLTIVGITARPPLGGRPRAFMTYPGMSALIGRADQLSEIEILVKPGVDPDALVESRREGLGEGVILQTTARITSGVEGNLRSTQLAFILACILGLLSASFIILTGLNTDFAERRRELAVLRCVGASRAQLGQSQLLIGLILGLAGAAVGTPSGIAVAAALTHLFREHVPSGLIIPTTGVLMATLGTIGAGLLGAAWPAWRTIRMSPLEALAARATLVRGRAIALCLAAALICLTSHLALVGLARAGQGQTLFWSYVFFGLPCLFVGYFVLGVPATWLVARIGSGPISALLGLPRNALRRSVMATPFRFGFTSGAMMAGLALMVAIWTEGGAFLRDWLGKMEFPDAFVSGLILPQEAQDTVDAMTQYVQGSVALSVIPVETDAFGVRALQRYQTNFIAFDPDRFFSMMTISWVQGDQESAVAALNRGGSVIVAREFLTAQGMGVGDTFTCRFEDQSHEFTIVGVVTSPGLELISRFFNIGEEFTAQAVHAVFGARHDARERFGVDAIRVIAIDLRDDADDAQAVAALRRELFPFGIADAGSGRAMKRDIIEFVRGTLVVFSGIAVMAMVVACFGVANLVVAGIELRRFEFGVLRAVGAPPGLLVRLVTGEALIIALAASLLGTLMGIQAAYAGTRLHALLFGVLINLRPPVGAIAVGWAFVFALTLAAATPPILRLARRRPRELLAAMRG